MSPLAHLAGYWRWSNFLSLFSFKRFSTRLKPSRAPAQGHYFIVDGISALLFIGFNRLWHFFYIRSDPLLCGIFHVVCLPVASSYWRYLDSMGINQGLSLLRVIRVLRERVWQVFGINDSRVKVNFDTTVETVYGDQQGARSSAEAKTGDARFQGIRDNTIRMARLKLLFVAAKVVKDAVKYSWYDSRTPALLAFYGFMDRLRIKPRPWGTVFGGT